MSWLFMFNEIIKETNKKGYSWVTSPLFLLTLFSSLNSLIFLSFLLCLFLVPCSSFLYLPTFSPFLRKAASEKKVVKFRSFIYTWKYHISMCDCTIQWNTFWHTSSVWFIESRNLEVWLHDFIVFCWHKSRYKATTFSWWGYHQHGILLKLRQFHCTTSKVLQYLWFWNMYICVK